MVLDVQKGYCDLHCIFSFSRSDKMLCIADISRSELGWTTTRGLWKVRTMFAGDSGHSRLIDTSYRRDSMSRLPSIKKREDVVEFARGYSLHDGGGWEQRVVLACLLH